MADAIYTRALGWTSGHGFEIRDVDLHVPEGSIYGFLGPNGAGKTTTIRLLTGMLRPASGRITVLERDVPNQVVSVLADVGYVPERPHLYPGLTVAETLRGHGRYHADWDRARAEDLLARWDLSGGHTIGRLSKGQTAKVMMILALCQNPRLLILDEPTDGLDPLVRREVVEAVVDYVATSAATVFISSHLVHELERICDWVGVMDAGRLVAEMPMHAFKNGIRRVRVTDVPTQLDDPPFTVLTRDTPSGVAGEFLVVRDWEDGMVEYLARVGAEVEEVSHLDLEDGFVELLRSGRSEAHV